MKWISTATLLVAIGLMAESRAMAQQEMYPQAPPDDIRARLEQQDREIQELRARLNGMQQGVPATEVSMETPAPAQGQAAAPAPQGQVVGSDMSLKGGLKDGFFPWFETPNKDFSLHVSAWVQYDNVFWSESAGLNAAKSATTTFNGGGPASGPALGGIGHLQDGMYFRRIRPNFEGTFFETCEYRIIPAFENNQFSTAGVDEMWVGLKELPVLGAVRVGHVKDPMGLEGDMSSSSRCMTFMERSSYSEAIELNQNFVTGLWAGNHVMDDNVTWQAAIFRADVAGSTGYYFGDGQWGAQARSTGLAFYEDEGRHLLHFGMSGGYRNGSAVFASSGTNPFTGPTVQLRARPEMRDDIPPGGGTNGNANRLVDTGILASNRQYLMGLESLYIRGPLSFQAEYGWNWVDNVIGTVQGVNSTTSTFHAFGSAHNYLFSGGYCQLAYTLTGEARGYDRKGGALSRSYFGKTGPYSPFWIVRDESGNICSSWGAWEIAARYSYIDLNDGAGSTRIQGGIMDGVGVGLNWYLNNNLAVNFDWNYDSRRDLPAGVNSGSTNGFGTRVQVQF